jgi:hypothetical protein
MDLRMDPDISTTAMPSSRRHVLAVICQGLPRHARQPIGQLRVMTRDLQPVISAAV